MGPKSHIQWAYMAPQLRAPDPPLLLLDSSEQGWAVLVWGVAHGCSRPSRGWAARASSQERGRQAAHVPLRPSLPNEFNSHIVPRPRPALPLLPPPRGILSPSRKFFRRSLTEASLFSPAVPLIWHRPPHRPVGAAAELPGLGLGREPGRPCSGELSTVPAAL